LAAGTYSYRWHAQGDEGLWNNSPVYSYVVAQADSVIALTLNGSSDNVTVELANPTVNIVSVGTLSTPSAGNVVVYENGTLKVNTTSPVSYTHNYTSVGVWNVTVKYFGDTNHTINESTTLYITVQDTTVPTVTMSEPSLSYYGTNMSIQATYTASDLSAFTNFYYSLDGNANKSEAGNFTFNTTEGAHTLYVYANDTYGNVGVDTASFTLDATSPVINAQWPGNNSESTQLLVTFAFNATDANPSEAMLFTNSTGSWTNVSTTTWTSEENTTLNYTLTGR
jgi:hypothetical protein